MKKSILVLISMFASLAWADGQQQEPVAYQVPVARLQGSLQCSASMPDQSFDCTLHVAGKAQSSIGMRAVKKKSGEVIGFYGTDKISEGGSNYSMVVSADANQKLRVLTLVTDSKSQDETKFAASMVSAAASDLHAMNITPFAVDISDSSAIKLNVGFTVYAKPESAIMTASSDDLIQLILSRVQPYLLTLVK
jgi:hypothetical protein